MVDSGFKPVVSSSATSFQFVQFIPRTHSSVTLVIVNWRHSQKQNCKGLPSSNIQMNTFCEINIVFFKGFWNLQLLQFRYFIKLYFYFRVDIESNIGVRISIFNQPGTRNTNQLHLTIINNNNDNNTIIPEHDWSICA